MATVITAIAMPALVAAYLATELLFKPPIPTTHIAGLIPTVTLIVTHHKLTTTNKTQRHQGAPIQTTNTNNTHSRTNTHSNTNSNTPQTHNHKQGSEAPRNKPDP